MISLVPIFTPCTILMLNLFLLSNVMKQLHKYILQNIIILYCYKSIRSTDLFADGNHRCNHRGSFNEQCMWAVMPHLSKL